MGHHESDGAPSGPDRKSVLIGGSDEETVCRVASVLQGSVIERVADNRAVLEALRTRAYDLVLTGTDSSGKEDLKLLEQMRLVRPQVKLIILAGESMREDVIAAMRQRAFSYFSRHYMDAAFDQMLFHAVNSPAWDDGIEVLSATPGWIRMVARCDSMTADRLIQFLNEIADLPEKERESVGFAFKEMLMNAMEHGGHFDPTQHVEISYVRGSRMIMCRVKDPGEGFSLEELCHAAVSNPPDDPMKHLQVRESRGLRPGGFGVLLAKKLVDELIYGEKGNEVLLIKYLD